MLEQRTKSETAKPQAAQKREEGGFRPRIDLLAGLSPRTSGESSAQNHASTLNRATASRPSLASHSLLGLQRQYGNRYVQRVLALARSGEGEAEVTPEVETTIGRARGGGQSLDHGTRRQMESAFGVDFGGVRIHTGAESYALNRAVNSVAFTTGSDIFFSNGSYDPASSAGRELLAHELTHVVQQSGSAVQSKLTVGEADDPYEREAEAVAKAVVSAIDSTAAPLVEKSEGASAGPVRRKCTCGSSSSLKGECEDCRAKRLANEQATANSGGRGILQEKPPTATLENDDITETLVRGGLIQRQDGDGGSDGGGGQSDGGGQQDPTQTVTTCTPTGRFTTIPSGKLTATFGSGKFGASFNMGAAFTAPIPCTCAAGEYRQSVRGYFKVNGTTLTHHLCANNLDPSVWHEDCATLSGTNYKYGYHSNGFGTSSFSDPDQATGCTFTGFDFPGIGTSSLSTGDTLDIHLEFQGKLVDASSGDAVLTSSSWSVEGTGTVP